MEPYAAMGVGMFVVQAAVFLPGLALFLARRHHEPVRSRGWEVAALQTLCLFVSGVFLLAGIASPTPLCNIVKAQSEMTVPTGAFPYFIRGWVLWHNYRHQEAMAGRKSGRVVSALLRLRWTTSLRFQLLCFLALFLAGFVNFLGIVLGDPASRLEYSLSPSLQHRCMTQGSAWSEVVQVSMASGGVLFFFLLLLPVRDAFMMRWEMFLALLFGGGLATVSLCSLFLPFPEVLGRAFWNFSIFISLTVITLWFPALVSIHQERSLRKVYSAVGLVDSSPSTASSLSSSPSKGTELEMALAEERRAERELFYAIMKGDTDLGLAFERLTIESWCFENLLFFRVESEYQSCPEKEREARAKDIWARFIEPGSSNEINIEEGVRERIMEALQQGNFGVELFGEARRAVVNILEHSVYCMWKRQPKVRKMLRQSQTQVQVQVQAQAQA